MHMDCHGSPDPIDDHLLERVLRNVCSVLELLGNTLKGSRYLRWFGNIWKHRVMIYEIGDGSN
jgi:hypothetical protein